MDIPGLPSIPDELFASCDSEPIHIPESIQPHGTLLGFRIQDLVLVFASTQAATDLKADCQSFAKREFDELFGCPGLGVQILALLQAHPGERLSLEFPGTWGRFDIEGHISKDGFLILEFEIPSQEFPERKKPLFVKGSGQIQDFKNVLLAIDKEPSFQVASEEVARAVRAITQYDRVMVYRFDQYGHGEVLVDDRRDDLESFLGLHYPASDIPKQARELYLQNRVRQIVDIDAEQVRMVRLDSKSEPLDMSLCHLRSASPVHRKYLQNMQVRSTLAVSIVVDKKLWGMIVCHHTTPKQLTSTKRSQCDVLAHVLSLAIQSEERRELERAASDSQEYYSQVEAAIAVDEGWKEYLLLRSSIMLDMLQATGAVFVNAGHQESIGIVPSSNIVDAICKSLANVGVQSIQAFESYDQPMLDGLVPENGGYLALKLTKSPDVFLIWFRQGEDRVVNWAGDPRKAAVRSGEADQLTPRNSFEKWQQEISGKCMPWTTQDHLRAKAFGLFVSVKNTEDANRLKSQFLTNMSHEIRTPMTAILGYTEILLEQIPVQSGATREAAETIHRNGQHLLAILNDLLDFAKIESGKSLSIKQEHVQFSSFLSETIDLVAANANKKGIGLEILVAPDVPDAIETDPTRLRQVVLNLLSNAIKFTESGKVTVQIAFSAVSSRLKISVIDTGCGISVNDLERLFRPFEQVDNSLSRSQTGTGLGLAISRHLLERMVGTLTVTSEVGKGSTFIAEIPVKIRGSISTKPSNQESTLLQTLQKDMRQQPAAIGSRMKILVAEDGPDNQRLIEWFLKRRLNADVTIVENGKSALDAALLAEKAEPFQLVLMDIQMPEMDGLSATKALRAAGFTRPIIALTAHVSDYDRELSKNAGCNSHICKPIKWEELNHAINTLFTNQSR